MIAIALDDEPAALEILRRHAEKVPFISLTHTFVSTAEALAFLSRNAVDVLFLDVQMPDMLGTDFARLLNNSKTHIIFVTAYPDYAVEGFALHALDYLLKPVEFGRFLQACNRALGQYSKKTGESSGIFVKDGYDWVRVNLDEILYIQSDTNLLFIHERTRKVTTRMTLNEMLAQLPPDRFLRIHKSYLVALNAIQKMERHQVTVGNVTIPLAGSYKGALEERLLK
ncbi:DNA-binding response regulator [Runella rosea]|uniref:DNA-binding response regulator n=1 Tax=Runella rosea TaxID=2259595 RepID=A0A344TKE5_9BACT|nr:LytTR family DNA-binding domain-containing protein [Runella rosea]AXE19116.1 DNA-binding response regulator [Runella rosea]